MKERQNYQQPDLDSIEELNYRQIQKMKKTITINKLQICR